jgi:threonine dehydrogenase-like Zn-dependent dehydrogenase
VHLAWTWQVGSEGPRDGGDVLILGLGGLGFQGLQLSKLMFGGVPPRVADIDDSKLEAARASGCAGAYNCLELASSAQIKKDTGGGVFAVIDFVGSEDSYAFAQASIRRGGCEAGGTTAHHSTAMCPPDSRAALRWPVLQRS